jgi:hypothetical protein
MHAWIHGVNACWIHSLQVLLPRTDGIEREKEWCAWTRCTSKSTAFEVTCNAILRLNTSRGKSSGKIRSEVRLGLGTPAEARPPGVRCGPQFSFFCRESSPRFTFFCTGRVTLAYKVRNVIPNAGLGAWKRHSFDFCRRISWHRIRNRVGLESKTVSSSVADFYVLQ